MPDDKVCEHNYLHLETIKRSKKEGQGQGNIFYQRTDLFYCTKCLKVEDRGVHSLQSDYKDAPVWW